MSESIDPPPRMDDSETISLDVRMTEADQRTFQRIAGRTWPVWAVAGIGVAGALIVALAIGASPVETAVGLAACVLLALYFQFRLVLGEREATLRFGPAGVEVLQDDYTNITYWLAINRIDFGRRLILLFSGPFLVAMLPTRGQSPERLRRLRDLVDRHAKWLGRTSPAPTQRPELPEGFSFATWYRMTAQQWNDAFDDLGRQSLRTLRFSVQGGIILVLFIAALVFCCLLTPALAVFGAFFVLVLAVGYSLRRAAARERSTEWPQADSVFACNLEECRFLSPKGQTRLAWAGVQEMIETKRFVFFVRRDYLLHPVPREAWESPEELDRALAFCRGRLEEASADSIPVEMLPEETGNPFQPPTRS